MHSFMLLVQFLDEVLDMPVVVLRQGLRLMVQKTVVPQLPSMECRRHSLRAAEADPQSPDCSALHRDSPVAVRFLVVDPCCAGRAVSGAAVEKTFVLPQLQLNHRCSVVQPAENCGNSAVAVHQGR